MKPSCPPCWALQPGRVLRHLTTADGAALATFFQSLGRETRQRFQPHPLDAAAAGRLCLEAGGPTLRLVVAERRAELEQIVGYFILEPEVSRHEIARFGSLGSLGR